MNQSMTKERTTEANPLLSAFQFFADRLQRWIVLRRCAEVGDLAILRLCGRRAGFCKGDDGFESD